MEHEHRSGAGGMAMTTAPDSQLDKARESDERLQLAAEVAHLGTWSFDPFTGTSDWSPELRSILLVGQDEPASFENALRMVHPEDADRVRQVWDGALVDGSGPSDFRHEFRILRQDGECRWIEERGRIFWKEGPESHRVASRAAGVLIDITERKRREQEIADLNERLRRRVEELETLLETLPVGVFTGTDPACSHITMNKAGAAMLGIAPDANPSLTAPRGNELPVRLYQDGRELTPDELPMQRSARLGVPIVGEEVDLVFSDGRRKNLYEYAHPLFDEQGKVRGSLGVFVDFTERRLAEDALRESEERLRAAQNAAALGIHDFDVASGRIRWDAHVRQLWGVAPDDPVTYEVFLAGIHPDDRASTQAAVDRALNPEGDGRYCAEYRVVNREDGVTRWVAATGQVSFVDARAARLVGTVQDISERRRQDEALHRAAEQQVILSEALGQLLTRDDPDRVLRELFPRVAAHLGVDVFFNYLVTADGKTLRLHSCSGVAEEVAHSLAHLEFGEGICGRVAAQAQPMIATSIQDSDERCADLVRGLGIKAYACNPLISGTRVLGTLSFGSSTKDAFEPAELEFMALIAKYVAVAIDRVSKDHALRTSEERFRTIFNTTNTGILLVSGDGVYLDVNPAICALLGRSREAIIGHRTDEFVVSGHEEFRQAVREEIDLRRSWRGEFPLRRADGSTIILDWHVSVLPDGNRLAAVVDVTERKRAEEALRERDELLRTAQLYGEAASWSVDLRTGRASATPEYNALYGIDVADDVSPGKWLESIHPEDREATETALRQARETGEFRAEFRYSHPMRGLRWFSARGRTVSQGSEAVRLVGLTVDITERKATEEALRRANEDLEQFTYAAAHDLQEPLRMVAVYNQLLERRYRDQLDAQANEFIAYSLDGANRMQALIRDLLAYARAGNAKEPAAVVDLNDVLRAAIGNIQGMIEEAGAEVTCDRLPSLTVSTVGIQQVLQNLIGNAIKYRRPEEPPRVHISVERRAEDWLFAVQDNGLGIERPFQEQVFGLFKRLHKDKSSGTGLGLAICRRVIERHGGRIWVESQPGQGSKFTFTLPENP